MYSETVWYTERMRKP